MLKLAAVAVAAITAATASTAADSPALKSAAPWWEKITVTMTGDGRPQSCRYESSLGTGDGCSVEGPTTAASAGSAKAEQFTKITFERRFAPGADLPDIGKLHPGDTLLGGQIMALAIDSAGSVKGCKVVAASGAMKPDYGCEEAAAEKFEASAGAKQGAQQAFMTILVYGHSEQIA